MLGNSILGCSDHYYAGPTVVPLMPTIRRSHCDAVTTIRRPHCGALDAVTTGPTVVPLITEAVYYRSCVL